eukprot:1604214-Pyramimonas_sp.AAC.1
MERWNDKWDNVGKASSDSDSDETVTTQEGDNMRSEFTVLGGSAYGGSAEGDKKILSILSSALIPKEKRPDFIVHHFAHWDTILWIRWQSDEARPFHDDLYLSFPQHASNSAIVLTEENKNIFKADMLTKVCLLAKEKNAQSLLRQAFRLLAPSLEESFTMLSPHYLERPNAGKTNDYAQLGRLLEAYGRVCEPGSNQHPCDVAVVMWSIGAEAGLLAVQREYGEHHPAALTGLRQLGATYAAHGKMLDCILEQVSPSSTTAQRAFTSIARSTTTRQTLKVPLCPLAWSTL